MLEFVKKNADMPLYKRESVWYNNRTSVRGFFFVRSRSGHDGTASPRPEGGTRSGTPPLRGSVRGPRSA